MRNCIFLALLVAKRYYAVHFRLSEIKLFSVVAISA